MVLDCDCCDCDDTDEWLVAAALGEDVVLEPESAADVVVPAPATDEPDVLDAVVPPAVDELPAERDWPTQLESGPAWMVIGEEYWMVPVLSRT